jgi:hypothetical protein
VQKSDFQEKSRKILQNSYFTRRPTKPEYEMERGWELGSPPGGSGGAGMQALGSFEPNRIHQFFIKLVYDIAN